jgi:hypothetical protein
MKDIPDNGITQVQTDLTDLTTDVTDLTTDVSDLTGDIADQLPEIGSGIVAAANATLYVSPNGDNSDGSSWSKAYNTINAALDAASTDGDDCTSIIISPQTTYYDIDTTGDPTWSGNYILVGTGRTWAVIRNDHASATSVLKFTGKVCLKNITINCGIGSNNGVIFSGADGSCLDNVYFESEDVTGAQTALTLEDGEYSIIKNVKFHGVSAHTTGILLDNYKLGNFEVIDFHDCLTSIKLTNSSSDNIFSYIYFHECTLSLDIDSGDNQFLHELAFVGCTDNVDDEVGNHSWINPHGAFPVTVEPDNFTGITVAAGVGANTWGSDTEIRAAATSTVPFRVVGIDIEADANEKFRVRLSSDSGTSFFMDIVVQGESAAARRVAASFPSETEFIFNKGTRISGSAKSESGGNNAVIWLDIQEI